MKKILFSSLCVLFIVTGCSKEEVEEKYVNEHSVIEKELNLKKPWKWEVVFVSEKYSLEEVLNLNEYGYIPSMGDMDEVSLAQLARNLALNIDRPMRNPTIDESGNIVKGENQVILSESELVDQLKSLSYNEKEVLLPIYENEPTVKEEDLEGIMDYLIGSYTTYFNPYVQGRSTNIKLSSKAINHYVLGPGDEFSFNQVVGQRTRERGYQEANEIINNEFVVGIGGGICQTSSTLFNAIDFAGLGIIERHGHSRDIGYVPPHRDATVSWGGPDFKFQNSYDYPILLKLEVSLQSGELKAEVYASKERELLVRAD